MLWIFLVGCALATIGLWLAYGTSRDWNTQGPDFVSQRLAIEQGTLWGAPAPRLPLPAAANVCNARARAALAKALSSPTSEGLEKVLVMDPDCEPAMRLLVQTAASQGQLAAFHARLIGRAEREPLNAVAQVGAAIFSDHAGRSGDMLAFLRRAEALRADTPGLFATWADYYRFHAQPSLPDKAWQAWMEELKHVEDPRTLAHVIDFLVHVPDRMAALTMCERFYRAVPQYAGAATARICLKAAVELDEGDAIAAYASRLGESAACQQRWVTYFRFAAGQPQARLQAADGDAACSQLFPWLRGAALLAQGRTAVAAAALGNLPGAPAWVVGAALAAAGKRDAALALLQRQPPHDESASARLYALLSADLIGPAGLVALVQPPAAATRGAHLAQAACGYERLGLATLAEQTLAQAVSASPGDPFVTACQLHWFANRRDKERIEAVVTRAAQLGLTHPLYTAELAHVRASQDRCLEALPLLQTAQMKLPLEPTLDEDLIRCLRRTNRTEEAERWAALTEPRNAQWPWLMAAAAVAVLFVGGLWLLKQRATRTVRR